MHMTRIARVCQSARRLSGDRSGLALLEFALSMPIVLALGLYGVETANLALANLRISQMALNLADNASRVGVQSSLATEQLREVDINDVLAALRNQGAAMKLSTRGRVTLSSLEEQNGNQVIHWQRCLGLKSGVGYASSYGATSATDGTDTNAANDGIISAGGMGDAGAKVIAPPNSGLMFVEINYDYMPVAGTAWLPSGATKLHYIASFIVRDRRDFSQIFNPAPATAAIRSTCDKFTT
jgi:Flp pilus assembly protein TadG